VGFSVMTEEFLENTLYAIRMVKQKYPDVTIIMGGMYPTWKAKDVLTDCTGIDYILRGEADRSIVEFIRHFHNHEDLSRIDGIIFLDNGACIEGRFPFIPPDVSELPVPVRDYASMAVSRHDLLSISTSRGCDFKCTFCGIHGFNGNRRSRTVEQIVEEIHTLKQTYNPKFINIVDPTLTGSGKEGLNTFKRLGLELQRLNTGIKFIFEIRPDQVEIESLTIWKQVGIKTLHIGVESGYLPTLKIFKKSTYPVINSAIDILESLSIPYTVGFIMFHPWTTLEEIKVNIEYSRTQLHGKNVLGLFNTLRMYAGSELSEHWEGSFSPYPDSRNYFFDPKVQLFFSYISAKETVDQVNTLIYKQQIDLLYDFLLKLLAGVEVSNHA
jgi:radical SAM superfamily enzyme YgiQ (UPF0313 family)